MIGRLARALWSRQGRRSYALNELDFKVLPFLGKAPGFFVEAGANDGVSQSNTLYLERHLGWTGLLVEPVPALAEKCRRNRPRCRVESCALVSRAAPGATVEMSYCNLMSIVKGAFGSDEADARHLKRGEQFLPAGEKARTLTVPAKTLAAVLAEHQIRRVDFMSLDVEGAELEALQGADFDAVAPALLLVEVRHDRAERINALLAPRYEAAATLHANKSYADVLYRLR